MKAVLSPCRYFFLFSIGILVFGCAQAPLKSDPTPKTENPARLISALGQDLAKARAEQVDLLSPGWFDEARKSHVAAKNGLDKGDGLEGILKALSKGRAQLDQALESADQSRYHLGDVIESRRMTLQAGGQRYKKDFSRLEDDFQSITRAVEKKNHKYIHNRKKTLNQGYRGLELRAIKDAALDDVRRMLDSLEDQKAHKVAPQSYVQAQTKLSQADVFITQNRYASSKIAAQAATARFYVQRLKEIADICTTLKPMDPEDIALHIEQYLHRTAAELGIPDQRNQSFDRQQVRIEGAVAAQMDQRISSADNIKAKDTKVAVLESQIESLKQQIAEIEGRTYQVKADKERLAAEKYFNELFNQVQGFFKDNEAEVYKQAGQLVIRLKAIQFPVGQAVIVPDNYGLLSKVQRAITTFGQPRIIVEGHTDSTGPPDKNEQLSRQRANSVRAYLIANGTLPGQLITAVGYGPSRPLAPNETAAGRAMNRRIDVVIKPKMK